MSVAIQVQDLFVRYERKGKAPVEAVQGLSFQVNEAEVVGFLGPNGAGKSSTLKALMGFVPFKRGDASILGMRAGTEEARAVVGYLPEVAMYYPYLTPLETLHLYGDLQGIEPSALRRQSHDLIDLVGLHELATRLNRTLSKGQLQRVGIAQALLGNPKVLILDEVTSGLDPIGRRQLRELLLDRRKQGTTLFFSSHELAEVEMLCDRVLLIDQGKLIEEREMEELQTELREFSLVYRGQASMAGLTNDVVQLEGGTVRASFHVKESLLAAIDRVFVNKGEIVDVVARDGSLEDYFVGRIGRAA